MVLACLSPAWAGSVPPSPPAGMAWIPGGSFKPQFRTAAESGEVRVAGFFLETIPVRNCDFLEFVRANPRWRRSSVPRLFADPSYLRHWTGDLSVPVGLSDVPVTHVSWFAAKAYAKWKDRRLPTVAEWEYAAGASPTRVDGENDPVHQREMLRWYSTPSPTVIPEVGKGRADLHGIQDLHGLVWEWTADFNSSFVSGDARSDSDTERQLFCGAGAQGATDRADYPAFMRFAFRSSLKAEYSIHNLGFRCVRTP